MAKLKKGQKYKESNALANIFARSGWSLYDLTNAPNHRLPWEMINKLKPVMEFKGGGVYFLIPTPQEGQTPEYAYRATLGLGPSLKITQPGDSRWISLTVHNGSRGLALFTRLIFDRDGLFVLVPEDANCMPPDCVGIEYDKVIETFETAYGIVTKESYAMGEHTPISAFSTPTH